MWKNKLYDHKQELQSVAISLCRYFISVLWIFWILEQGLKSLISEDRGKSANPPNPQSKIRGLLFVLSDSTEVHNTVYAEFVSFPRRFVTCQV